MEKPYLAGLLDGEGCIMIAKSKRQGKKNYEYCLRVFVSNSHLLGLQEVQKYFGGWLNEVKPDKNRFSQNRCWRLWWNGKSGANLLEQLKPYLVIKKRQAELALQFAILRDRNPKDVNVLNVYYQEIAREKRVHLVPYNPQRLSEETSSSVLEEAIVQTVT